MNVLGCHGATQDKPLQTAHMLCSEETQRGTGRDGMGGNGASDGRGTGRVGIGHNGASDSCATKVGVCRVALLQAGGDSDGRGTGRVGMGHDGASDS